MHHPYSMPNVIVSVIIPARNCREDLRQCLDALGRSHFRDFEVIVVDDASTDGTAGDLAPDEARVESLAEQSGPAAARNRGAELARGDYLVFVDADVLVRPETLGLIVTTLAQNPDVAAVFGSYDTEPQAQNMLSQYRNLMHHFVHQDGREEASTFWAGCGAIRREVFLEVGGFQSAYRRPCIEDIELGIRLRKADHRIRLVKSLQVTHLKRWTLYGMLRTDIRDRALPWSQLILREGSLPNDLNLNTANRVSALLACGLFAALLVGALSLPALLALPPLFFAAVALVDGWSARFRVPTTVRLGSVVAAAAGVIYLFVHFGLVSLIPLSMLVGLIVLNGRFYLFLGRSRDPVYGLLAVPLHVLFYLYSTATFAFAVVLHVVAPYKKSLPVKPLDPIHL